MTSRLQITPETRAVFEDVALSMAPGRARLRPMPAALTTSAARFHERGWAFSLVGKSFRFAPYLLGIPPKPPARR